MHVLGIADSARKNSDSVKNFGPGSIIWIRFNLLRSGSKGSGFSPKSSDLVRKVWNGENFLILFRKAGSGPKNSDPVFIIIICIFFTIQTYLVLIYFRYIGLRIRLENFGSVTPQQTQFFVSWISEFWIYFLNLTFSAFTPTHICTWGFGSNADPDP